MCKIYMIILGMLIMGCSDKNASEETIQKTYDEKSVSIKTSETDEFTILLMKNMPAEGGGPFISCDPRHSIISEIKHTREGVIYNYQAKEGFVGTDTVEITTNISAGGPEVDSKLITKLTIEVTE